MAATSHTPNLGLCSWSDSDKPKRLDFVTDNLLIDEKLGTHLSDPDIHVTKQEKERFSTPFSVVEYAGDGKNQRSISVSGEYSFVIVYQKFYPAVTKDNDGNIVSHLGFAGRLFGSGSEITLSNSAITVTQDSTATDGVKYNFNESNGQYVAILFK